MSLDDPTSIPVDSLITSDRLYVPEPVYPSPQLHVTVAGRPGVFAPDRYTGDPITLPAGITLRGLPDGYEATAGPDDSLVITPQKDWLERQDQIKRIYREADKTFNRAFMDATRPTKKDEEA